MYGDERFEVKAHLTSTLTPVPGPPGEVNNEGKPQHNSIKISWTPPPNPNGTLTGYVIYSDGWCSVKPIIYLVSQYTG